MKKNLYLLCGGKSVRMGSDKALIKSGGKTLLELIIQKADPCFNEIVLLAGTNTYSVARRALPDALEDAGPLGGLLGALEDAAALGYSDVCILPVDLPAIKPETIRKLAEFELNHPQFKHHFDAAVLHSKSGGEEGFQPLSGVYGTHLIPLLSRYLGDGNRKVMEFVLSTRVRRIDADDDELQNWNSPGDMPR